MPLHGIIGLDHFGVWQQDASRGVRPSPQNESRINSAGYSFRVSGCGCYCQCHFPYYMYFLFQGSRNVRTKTGRSHVAGMKHEEKTGNSRETRSAVPFSHCSSEEVLHANMNICISKAWSLYKKNASRAFPCQHPKAVASLLQPATNSQAAAIWTSRKIWKNRIAWVFHNHWRKITEL